MSPIVNLQLVVKCKKRSFHSFKVEVALLRYIVFYCELGCDTSEPHVSYISRACSSLVRQPYYAPNSFILKISGLETILATKKGRWDGRSFYMDEYTLIFLFSRCIRCAQSETVWRAFGSHPKGRGFDSLRVHKTPYRLTRYGVSFCHSLQNRASFVLTAQNRVCSIFRHNAYGFTCCFV